MTDRFRFTTGVLASSILAASGCSTQSVLFTSNPPGARVYVDGWYQGRTPLIEHYSKPIQFRSFPLGPLFVERVGTVRFEPSDETRATANRRPLKAVEFEFFKWTNNAFLALGHEPHPPEVDREYTATLYADDAELPSKDTPP